MPDPAPLPPPRPRPLEVAAVPHLPSAAPEIRPAMAGDLAAITAIQAAAVRGATAGSAVLDLRQVTALRERLVVQGYPCLVALRDGAVVGYAFAQRFAEREVWRGTVEPVLAVDPRAAGQGVGRALLAALVAACEARGFRRMVAVVPGDGSGATLAALHESMGFARAGLLPGMPGEAVLLLQRSLGQEGRARDAA